MDNTAIKYWNTIQLLFNQDEKVDPILIQIMKSDTPLNLEQYEFLTAKDSVKQFIEDDLLLNKNLDLQSRFITNFPYRKTAEINALEDPIALNQFLQDYFYNFQQESVAEANPIAPAESILVPVTTQNQTSNFDQIPEFNQFFDLAQQSQSVLPDTVPIPSEPAAISTEVTESTEQSVEVTDSSSTNLESTLYSAYSKPVLPEQNLVFSDSVQAVKANFKQREQKRQERLQQKNIIAMNQQSANIYQQAMQQSVAKQRLASSQNLKQQLPSARLKNAISRVVLGGFAATLATSGLIPLFFI